MKTLDQIHASVPPCVLASVGLSHHNSAILWPISELSDPPARLTLHPVTGSSNSTVQDLRQGSSTYLQTMLAAWLECQSAANSEVASSFRTAEC